MDELVEIIGQALADAEGLTYSRYRKLFSEQARDILSALSSKGLAVVKGWQPIETAPKDGRRALVYRPLAEKSGDEPVAIKQLTGGDGHCWPCTVPEGATPTNPTDGSCHVTHWMPLPAAPKEGPDAILKAALKSESELMPNPRFARPKEGQGA